MEPMLRRNPISGIFEMVNVDENGKVIENDPDIDLSPEPKEIPLQKQSPMLKLKEKGIKNDRKGGGHS